MARALFVCSLVLIVAARAEAQRALDLQLYQPAPGPLAALALERATPLPHATWLLGLSASFAHDLLPRRADCDPGATLVDAACVEADGRTLVVSDLLQVEASAALGLFGAMELGAVLPLSLVRAADDLAMPSELRSGVGLGDARLAVKAAILRGRETLAFVMRASLPTGDEGELRGERRWTATPTVVLGLFTDREGESLLSAALGYRLRTREAPPGLAFELDDELDAGLALSLRAASWLRVLAELRVRAGVGGRELRRNEVPVELDLGVRFALGPTLLAFVGVGSGAWPERDAYGAPDYRVLGGLRARLAPGGCGAGEACAGDADGDGLPDDVDGCPYAAEDHDGFADRDGCPDRDDDADGIADAADACPRATEDLDGFEDHDGCPEPDNDADGVADGEDTCAMDPEDADGFEDADGCPEPGPEPVRISVIEGRILISERVFFEFERDTIRSVSMPLLDELAEVIRDLPDDTLVQIEGHTDDTGNAAYNLDLSYRRAVAVATYLRARGVAASRLRAVGYGAREPVAGNDSPEGRALNRRVEFTLHKR